MNYIVVGITFFVSTLFLLQISCKLPIQETDICTDLGRLDKFIKKQWKIIKNRREIISGRSRKGFKLFKRSNHDNKSNNKDGKNKIIAGHERIPNFSFTLPYFVGIHFRRDYNSMAQCGGVLIKPNWILTSENCIT